MKRLSVDELTRRAFIWAEQDRAGLADSWPVGSRERKKAQDQYEQLKAYRTKRWGRTKMEAILSTATTVGVFDLKAVSPK